MNPDSATTTFTFDGHRIVRYLGIARGITVRSQSVIGTFASGINRLIGGHIGLLTVLCERTRSDAFEIMLAHAERMGANAVIGMRYDATEVMSGATEVICYGTAVVIESIALEPDVP
jgi:uncharacterized protein YbjQ (UPF0145 family)